MRHRRRSSRYKSNPGIKLSTICFLVGGGLLAYYLITKGAKAAQAAASPLAMPATPVAEEAPPTLKEQAIQASIDMANQASGELGLPIQMS